MELSPASARATLTGVRNDPVAFAEEILGLHPWSKQREILESVRDNQRTAVRSCHGVGKTAAAAAVVLWFLAAFPQESIVVTTAPGWRQVRDLLWREIAKLYHRTNGFFDGTLTETRLDFGPSWYAVGMSTREPENFQGYHAQNLLFVVDEASGVRQPIFDAAEGFLTGDGARVLLIGNPTQVAGQFFDAFHREQALWHTIHIGAHDSPNFTREKVPAPVARSLVSKAWVEDKKVKWGEESGIYAVRVLGDFPDQSDYAVVSLGDVEDAQQREQELHDPGWDYADLTDDQRAILDQSWPVVISCDPARFGSDETVVAVRQGNHVRIVDAYMGKATTHTVGAILRAARAHDPHPLYGKPVIVVDEIGIGGGIIDQLREQHDYRVIAYNASAAPAEANENEYPNARSELWFEFAHDWLPVLDLDPDDQLAADLLGPEYVIDSKGRRVVEKKEETKKRLGRSPDRADAVMMAYCRAANMGGRVRLPAGPPVPGGASRWRGMGEQAEGRSRWR